MHWSGGDTGTNQQVITVTPTRNDGVMKAGESEVREEGGSVSY